MSEVLAELGLRRRGFEVTARLKGVWKARNWVKECDAAAKNAGCKNSFKDVM
jgi:hypothetical protein